MAEFTRLTEENSQETLCREYRQRVKNYKENLITQITFFYRSLKLLKNFTDYEKKTMKRLLSIWIPQRILQEADSET
jgi:hypothetical protein